MNQYYLPAMERAIVAPNTNFIQDLEDIEQNNDFIFNLEEILRELNENYDAFANKLPHENAHESDLLWEVDENTESILRIIKSDLPQKIKKLEQNVKTLNLSRKTMDFFGFIDFYWQQANSLYTVPKDKLVEKLQLFPTKYDEISYDSLRDLLVTILALPENSSEELINFIFDLLFCGVQTCVFQICFKFRQFCILAANYFQRGDIAQYNKHLDSLYLHHERSKQQMLGYTEGNGLIFEVQDCYNKFLEKSIKCQGKHWYELFWQRARYFKDFHNLSIWDNFYVSLDRPGQIIAAPSFKNSPIKTHRALGAWQNTMTVSYAMQYFHNGVYSKISEWSVPLEIADKASPVLYLPPTQHPGTKLIFRQFDQQTPELVGKIDAKGQKIFYDVNRDLLNVAKNVDREITATELEIFNYSVLPSIVLENDFTAMHVAALAGNASFIEKCLMADLPIDINKINKYGCTALHIAAQYGHEDVLKLLLRHGVDPKMKTKFNLMTPMLIAAYSGQTRIMEILLRFESTDDVQRDDQGCTLLHCGVFGGEGVVNLLIENPMCAVNARNNAGLTPLHMAILHKDINVAKALLRNVEVSVETRTGSNLTGFHLAIITQNIDMINYLQTARIVDVNAKTFRDWTALHLAVATSTKNLVSELLKQRKLNLDARTRGGLTPLHVAARRNKGKIIRLLIAAGATIAVRTTMGLTPLHMAVKFGSKDALSALIEHKVDLELKFIDMTPLLLAAHSKSSSADVLVELIENNCNLKATNAEGLTFEWLAAQQGSTDVVSFLVKKYEGPNLTDHNGNNLLHHAVQGSNIAVVALLIDECKFGVNVLNRHQQSALHFAKDLKTIEFLLQRGASLDAANVFENLLEQQTGTANPAKETILHYAASRDNLKIIKLLVEEKGFDANFMDSYGNTPLHVAARCGMLDIVKYFVQERKIDLNIMGHESDTAPKLAAIYGHLNMIKYFYDEIKTNINHRDDLGNTILHHAAAGGYLEIITYLIEQKKIDLNTRNLIGQTPFLMAAQSGQLKAVKFFIEVKKVDSQMSSDENGQTALHLAALKGHLNVVKYLINEQGANIHVKTKLNTTPILLAVSGNHLATVKFLLEQGANLNDKNKMDGGLLHYATAGNSVEIIRYLMDEKKLDPSFSFTISKAFNGDIAKYLSKTKNASHGI